jgi:hypothetical protein
MESSTYRLAQRPALPNGNLIPVLHTKRRAHMRREIAVSLLVSRVLGNEMEVLAADDQSTMHLGADDGAGQDSSADGDLAGEGAFLV